MSTGTPYAELRFPEAPPDRPYTILDMVATVDGKIVSGDPGEDVSDLGSSVDHAVLRHLEDLADGVLVGAGTLRATPSGWDPKTRFRVVVSKSGKVDSNHSFFNGPQAFVGLPEGARFQPANGVTPLFAGSGEVDPKLLLKSLRERGCERLLVLGGSRTNGAFLHANVIDEIFLTVAPKVKLGMGLPTIADGPPFPREALLTLELIEHHAVGDEIFLRYRAAGKR